MLEHPVVCFLVGLALSDKFVAIFVEKGSACSDDGSSAQVLSVRFVPFRGLWPQRGHQERIMRAEVQQEPVAWLVGTCWNTLLFVFW